MSGPELISLGCRLNIAENERMRGMLAGEDNLVVINSCAVTSEAVRQTRQAIRKARKARPHARLLVTGCAADIEREQLADMPEVDGLIANEAKLDPRAWNVPVDAPPLPPTRTRAFIAVQNGCDHACTFCVIPQGRGKSRSMTIDAVKGEVEHHLAQGAREVVLTGVDVTSWGQDLPGKPPLGRMVASILDAIPELQRLRMSSLDGIEIDEQLFDLFASEARLMPHLHLSLQHGHDLILKRMKRRHLRNDAVDLVTKLKARRPEITIGADLIAGFPTETEEHHQANLSIIRECDIVHGHIFPYSPRPDTPAARMPQLDRSAIKARASELRAAVSDVRSQWLQSLVGKELSVLAERDGTGYAPNFARISVPSGIAAGEITTISPTEVVEGMLV
ncbi:MiaB/RimO family radical SAM methylthiotransferase [Altererythrobacter sp.]|uniref:MiaB/RimO family radical SAM methylthiotransferase n=1 Tax=Altererythrobacter sp. TaxID=1872480 RepID=UPI001B127F8F|nr:MiaB/RimO family radical SAM methylthiotransferase [Altererythrobacter sp.]MBO6609696.1 MiaB/RimO family radical SAM methylthiotransferase [Altererythrobacter sp.]MBO6641154.1 MiaB/RimO family radical SAM methylthiotransferase [Altererythrobacter sp.]MBO6708148.1 MiaB/RimO family radical SAM methylthiotransferase [Altererythrobacter sp.]